VVSCSALRRRYRDFIGARSGVAPLFVHPVMDRATLRDRLAARRGHYMPVSLLDSQFAALEPPSPDERAITVLGDQPIDRQIATIEERLGTRRLAVRPILD
jgi:gluconokinase